MKYLLRFLLIYVTILSLILIFYVTITDQYQKDLSITNNELEGIEYLKGVNKLTVSLISYRSVQNLKNDNTQVDNAKKLLLKHIQNIHTLQVKYPQFKNSLFNQKLSFEKISAMSEDQYYKFLGSINHENYEIGDISKILFEEDRKIYFLGSLMTHYLPEFLISALISHNKINEFYINGHISLKNRNIFTEQNKLFHLSTQELSEIIKLLEPYKETLILHTIMNDIFLELQNLSEYENFLSSWSPDTQEIKLYLDSSHKLLDLAFFLNENNTQILQKSINDRKISLEEKIVIHRILLIFICLLITAILFYFYRSFRSNIKKDLEIKNINKTLDNLVPFSKTDINGKITYVSTALEKLSGFSRSELIGYSHRKFKHEDMDPSVYADLWNTILAKKVWIGELKNKTKNGDAYWVKITISPELDAGGNITGFSSHKEDITDKKKLEVEKRKTQEALKFKSMFLSNMSHEIRTPLNGIIGLTSVALKTNLDEKQKELMDKIQSSSNILLGVVNDILDISKIESGKMTIEKSHFNLKTLVNNIHSMLFEKASEKGITFTTECKELQHDTFIGDSLRISQVLTNLLNNAIKFTSKGYVKLHISHLNDEQIRFAVIDSGIGIKEEQLHSLFKEFIQADMSTSRKYGGTGLGLAISKNLVELMGGVIVVESELGKGSRFYFDLPLSPSNEADADENLNEQELKLLEKKINSMQGVKILVAEDNKMNQMVLSMLLEDSKLELDFALDGEVAVAKCKENRYDLILMDIQMPNLNGYEATQAIRQIDTDIPIIGLSANAMKEDVQKAIGFGMNGYLAKPIDLNEMYKVLSKFLIKD